MKLSIISLFTLLGFSSAAKKYVLRVDDVQDYWISDTQQAIINWCIANNVAVNLGVIGGFFGNDASMVTALKDCLAQGSTKCEVFNHGQDATNRLGDMTDLSQIQGLIAESHDVIQTTLGYTPRSFVPHENSWSTLVTQALSNLGYDVISASPNEGMLFDMTKDPVRMPQKTETSEYVGGVWVARNPIDIFADCQAADVNGDEAVVIMSHPQEYSEGIFTLDNLAALKQLLDNDGWTSHTFSEIASPFLPPRPSPAPNTPPPTSAPGHKTFVFRVDDVQDYFQASAQQSLIQWAINNNVAINLGVIGGFFGNDASMVTALKDCLKLGPSRCEVFNHGQDATNRLGDMTDLSQIQGLIAASHDVIQTTLGYTPRSFVPHENSWSELLTQALSNLGYGVISASPNEGMTFDMSLDPVHMPQQTETSEYVGGGWRARNPADIFADCEAARLNGDASCVIMSHPQEYGEGIFTEADLDVLKALLDANGWTSSTFSDVASPFLPPRPSPAPNTPPPTSAPGPKNFVLRLDDVQDYFNAASQRDVIQFCMNNNIAINIGVIGGFFGADNSVVQVVSDCLDLGSDKCEVFNHGLDATYRLGDLTDPNQIQDLVSTSHDTIYGVLGYAPHSFVPHENSWSDMLTDVLNNLGYNVISASPNEGMTFDMSVVPVHMPQQTETAQYAAGGWVGQQPADILAACQAARLNGDESCVIMMHPQDYADNAFTISDLQTLTDLLISNGWTSHTFGDIAAPFVPTRPTPAPNTPAPTQATPEIALYGQCGTTGGGANFGYNCAAGNYCVYGGVWWSSCQPCSVPPNVASETQYNARCNTAPTPTVPSAPTPTEAPVSSPTSSPSLRPTTSAPTMTPPQGTPAPSVSGGTGSGCCSMEWKTCDTFWCGDNAASCAACGVNYRWLPQGELSGCSGKWGPCAQASDCCNSDLVCTWSQCVPAR